MHSTVYTVRADMDKLFQDCMLQTQSTLIKAGVFVSSDICARYSCSCGDMWFQHRHRQRDSDI